MTDILSQTETAHPEDPMDPRVETMIEQTGLSSYAGRAAMVGAWPRTELPHDGRERHIRGNPRYGVVREVGDHALMIAEEIARPAEGYEQLTIPGIPGAKQMEAREIATTAANAADARRHEPHAAARARARAEKSARRRAEFE